MIYVLRSTITNGDTTMCNEAISFFNNLSLNKIEVHQIEERIHDYMQTYDAKEAVPLKVLEKSHLDTKQFLDRHRQDVASFFHKAVDLERSFRQEDYVDNINFSIFSVDNIKVSSMSLEERGQLLLEIKLRLNTCPFLSSSSFIVYEFKDLIWIEWTMPIPIRTSSFSDGQLKESEGNILRYFNRYFDTKNCSIKFFNLSSLYDAIQSPAQGAEHYYEKVFFPNVFLECLGLSIVYKLP